MNRNNQIADAVRTQLSCQLCIGLIRENYYVEMVIKKLLRGVKDE